VREHLRRSHGPSAENDSPSPGGEGRGEGGRSPDPDPKGREQRGEQMTKCKRQLELLHTTNLCSRPRRASGTPSQPVQGGSVRGSGCERGLLTQVCAALDRDGSSVVIASNNDCNAAHRRSWPFRLRCIAGRTDPMVEGHGRIGRDLTSNVVALFPGIFSVLCFRCAAAVVFVSSRKMAVARYGNCGRTMFGGFGSADPIHSDPWRAAYSLLLAAVRILQSCQKRALIAAVVDTAHGQAEFLHIARASRA
jgi:hypothetical protein